MDNMQIRKIMGFRTSLPEKKVLDFAIVNCTFRAIFAVFFMSLLTAGFCVAAAASLADFSAAAGAAAWLVLTTAAFALLMKVRDSAVRGEIENGRHDPVWGKHIRRQSQREADALLEHNRLTRLLFRLACLLGIHKRR